MSTTVLTVTINGVTFQSITQEGISGGSRALVVNYWIRTATSVECITSYEVFADRMYAEMTRNYPHVKAVIDHAHSRLLK